MSNGSVSPELKQKVIARCLDNTEGLENFKTSGIFYFAKNFLPKQFYNDFGNLHYELSVLFFSLLHPDKTIRAERQAYLLVHREGAKSAFFSYLIPLFLIYMQGRRIKFRFYENPNWIKEDNPKYTIVETEPIDDKVILIASETSNQAKRFVDDIRMTIAQNTQLNGVFGERSIFEVEVDDNARRTTKKWAADAFYTAGGKIETGDPEKPFIELSPVAVLGVGSGQGVRGIKINGHRPTTIIIDDMYSEKNTKTESSRKNLSHWFHDAVINSADSQSGKILWAGTMLHVDTIVNDFRKSKQWYGIERPIISMEELNIVLDKIRKEDNTLRIDKDELTKLEAECTTLTWRERHSLYSIMMKYDEKLQQGKLGSFYKESMNEPIDPQAAMVLRENFVNLKMEFYVEDDYQMCRYIRHGIEWTGECYLYLGLDPASSMANKSDDTAIVVAGFGRFFPTIPGKSREDVANSKYEGYIHPVIAHVEGGKYALKEHEGRKGMVEACMDLNDRFKLQKLKIEAIQAQAQIVKEVRQAIKYGLAKVNMETRRSRRPEVKIEGIFHHEKKEERIANEIYSLVHTYSEVLSNNSPYIDLIWQQLVTLDGNGHDDYVDSYAIAMKDAKIPPVRDFDKTYREQERRPLSKRERFKDVNDWIVF
jgi:hypothetical protein